MDPHVIDVVSREFLITYDAEFKRVHRSEVELPNHEENRTYYDVLDLYNYQGVCGISELNMHGAFFCNRLYLSTFLSCVPFFFLSLSSGCIL